MTAAEALSHPRIRNTNDVKVPLVGGGGGGKCTVLSTAGVISLREPLPDQASSAVTSPC
ncbi:hypothetical protein Hanom_Chr05g00468071 [Helianthus anomalus]